MVSIMPEQFNVRCCCDCLLYPMLRAEQAVLHVGDIVAVWYVEHVCLSLIIMPLPTQGANLDCLGLRSHESLYHSIGVLQGTYKI